VVADGGEAHVQTDAEPGTAVVAGSAHRFPAVDVDVAVVKTPSAVGDRVVKGSKPGVVASRQKGPAPLQAGEPRVGWTPVVLVEEGLDLGPEIGEGGAGSRIVGGVTHVVVC
jgi:hypothetical protein